MSFFAYLLRCNDGSFYAGHTDALEWRIAQHHAGEGSAHTKHRRPVELVWSNAFPTRLEALEAERRIKGWSRAKKEALVRGDWTGMQLLSRNWQTEGRPSTGSGRTVEGDTRNAVRPELVEGRPSSRLKNDAHG
ncbi:GIY-YIG nuclease family protein [Sphingomonas baiyangensis]|uniref:GIY-YIG nuclease family protein n=1 Tax=Sphingomonas baiyangensis TaxID=2572576 RepID=A0A4U1L7E0_9SPHN|nr:GIY-YIG nuclease family protein [Sphingomonas baiyangensis]TKD52867.1 GIY-YIG nuclease family protein [Sphingomonas baiyangensis]